MGSQIFITKMGFYYNQQPQQGFYYNQQPQKGFYYNQQPKQGFYYNNENQKEGFYYNQPEGFYYNQPEGFYYDNQDSKKTKVANKAKAVNHSAAWKGDEYASKVMDAVIDRASKVLTGHFVANEHQPGPIENRVVAQISAERMCYEAAEIWMNENQPNPALSPEDIHKQLFEFVKASIQKKDAPAP